MRITVSCYFLTPLTTSQLLFNDLAKLGGTLGKAVNTVFDQIGHWFNGVFGNVMGEVMMFLFAMIVPLLDNCVLLLLYV